MMAVQVAVTSIVSAAGTRVMSIHRHGLGWASLTTRAAHIPGVPPEGTSGQRVGHPTVGNQERRMEQGEPFFKHAASG